MLRKNSWKKDLTCCNEACGYTFVPEKEIENTEADGKKSDQKGNKNLSVADKTDEKNEIKDPLPDAESDPPFDVPTVEKQEEQK